MNFTPIDERNCANCNFFRFKYETDANGECRRHPPQVVIGWPTVEANDWCGEWVWRQRDSNPTIPEVTRKEQ